MTIKSAIIDNGTGQFVRTEIQANLQALKSNNADIDEPAGNNLTTYMSWADTTNLQYTIHNGSNFHPLMDIQQQTGFAGTHLAVPGSNVCPGYRFLNNSGTATQTGMGLPADNRIGFFHGSVERMSLLSNGSVGIGTTAPVTGLHCVDHDVTIQRNSSNNDAILNIMHLASDEAGKAYIDLTADQTFTDYGFRVIRNGGENGVSALQHQGTGNLIIQCESTGSIEFVTNKNNTTTTNHRRWEISGAAGSEGSFISNQRTIDNALTTAGAAFNINGDAFEGLSLVKNSYGWGTPLFIHLLNFGSSSGFDSTENLVEFRANTSATGDGQFVGSINTNGSTTAFNTNVSDRSLKKNFEDWDENTLNLFKNLNPQKYNYLHQEDTDTKDKGFIAQEIADSFPEAYLKDKNDKYMFNPSGMVVYIMKALQEAVAKIETLEAKVAVLEGS
tara:strand:+ start:140 stop:1471 length:1332 start_codon:yes stop_codon:yes gene_type:complete